MKPGNVLLSLLVFLCFTIYVVGEMKIPCKETEGENNEITKRLRVQNDSLRKVNAALDEKYESFQHKVDSIRGKLIQTKQTIVQLKTKQHEKVNAIDKLSGNELYSYFSNFGTEDKTGR